jgi:DNA-binding NarL/FixJ family response regulator
VAATALIADDDKRFRGSIRMLIQGVAHVIGEAESDATAISLARALEPDVILIDHDLPRAGGIETARQIKGAQPQILVVLMTSRGEEAYLEGTGRSGADALLPKKYVRTEARAVLRRLFAGVPRPWEGRRDRRPGR